MLWETSHMNSKGRSDWLSTCKNVQPVLEVLKIIGLLQDRHRTLYEGGK